MRAFDVIVAGSGPAGIAAAITAQARGKSVALIEKGPRLGGTGLGSAYGIWIPHNRHLRRLGIVDGRARCIELMCLHSFPELYDPDAERCGVPEDDYPLFEAYYDHASKMLDLFERETGMLASPMRNHGQDFDTYDRTRELLEARGLLRSEDMIRWLPDYHAEDPLNDAPVGRYLSFGPTLPTALLYYGRILRELGAETILRSTLQMMNPFVLAPMLRGLVGKHAEGVLSYAGAGVRISRFARPFLSGKGVHVATDTGLSEVLFDDRGAVRGVEVTTASGKATMATKHLILTVGGFNYDRALLEEFAAQTPLVGSNGTPTNTGDALKSLRKHDVKLGHMDQFWLTESVYEGVAHKSTYDPYASHNVWYLNGDSFLVVDQHGKRCYDESKPYSIRAKYYQRPDRELTFLVFDERLYRRFGGVFRYLGAGVPARLPFGLLKPEHVHHGKDVQELSQHFRRVLDRYRDVMDVSLSVRFTDTLQASIESFNVYAERGVDPDFGRGSQLGYTAWQTARAPDNRYPNPTMHPMNLDGGLYGVVLCATCFSTKGGLGIDRSARVLKNDGQPLKGLYAAGNCSASPSNSGYVLSTIGPAMTFGYIAACHDPEAQDPEAGT